MQNHVQTLDVDDIARLFKKNRSIIYKILRENPDELPPARRVGRFYFWHPDVVSDWLKDSKPDSSKLKSEESRFSIVGRRKKSGSAQGA